MFYANHQKATVPRQFCSCSSKKKIRDGMFYFQAVGDDFNLIYLALKTDIISQKRFNCFQQ